MMVPSKIDRQRFGILLANSDVAEIMTKRLLTPYFLEFALGDVSFEAVRKAIGCL